MMKRLLWGVLTVVLVAIGAGMVTLFLDYSSTDKDLRAQYEKSASDRRELRAELARQEETSRALADQVTALGEEPVVEPPATTTIQGLAGPRGIPGVTGPRGPQGPSGATGATGEAGSTGQAGESGPGGAQGAQGPKGDTGATGATGPQGPAGDKGEKGDPGPLCPTGTTATQIWVQTRTDPFLPSTQQWRQAWICTTTS